MWVRVPPPLPDKNYGSLPAPTGREPFQGVPTVEAGTLLILAWRLHGLQRYNRESEHKLAQTFDYINVTGPDGGFVTMPFYASWVDFAADDSRTFDEKVEMLKVLSDYLHSRPDDWPRWNDGSPVMVGQTAMSMYGPMTIGRMDIRLDGTYTLYTKTGYEINSGTKDNPCERFGEFQDYWPGNDDNFAEHVFYHEAMGLIGPQCEGGKYSWELGLHPPYCIEDQRFPKGIDHRIPVRYEM